MSDKMREALEWLADEMRSELTDDGASLPQWLVKSWLKRCTAALAEQHAQGEALKPGQYVIEYNSDGEFGQATGWLYRDGGYPCVVTGTPVYVWRRLRDLIGKPPAPAVPDELREVIRDACREWQSYVEVDTAPMSCRDYVMREVDAWLAAAPEVPRG